MLREYESRFAVVSTFQYETLITEQSVRSSQKKLIVCICMEARLCLTVWILFAMLMYLYLMDIFSRSMDAKNTVKREARSAKIQVQFGSISKL